MSKIRFSFRILATGLFILTLTAITHAQATRTWVSGVGDDVNPCSRTAPCKTFAGAISKTFIGGEIDALDPGGFGTVTITKSITIDGGSAFASILASGTNGVNINIAAGNVNDPNRRVTLRRLSINGAGASGAVGTSTGIRGINGNTNGFAQLYVENCYIQNFTTAGIDATVTTTGAYMSIRDTNINNTGIGIQMNLNVAGGAGLMVDNVRVEKGTTGIILKDRIFASVRNSIISTHTTAGISVQAPSNSGSLNVENTFFVGDVTGIVAGAAATTVDVSNSSFVLNTNAFATGGATINSHGNNQISGTVGAALNPVGQQ